MTDPAPHSADVLNATRDAWWREDFIRLVAERLRLEGVRRGLDVGCGQGHWDRTLLGVLPPEATLVGVDKEYAWVQTATEEARRHGLGDRTEHAVASAENLPFPTGSFDLVTCQTVLMHFADPETALREMVRVLEPGGLLLAAEPNNEALVLVNGSTNFDPPMEELLDQVRFTRFVSRGLRALGQGDQTLGDRLPDLSTESTCRTSTCARTSAAARSFRRTTTRSSRGGSANAASSPLDPAGCGSPKRPGRSC